jgi:hypothetical protein
MTSTLRITNHGPLIVASNYWDSELARAGKLFVSVNAGAIRILLPPASYGALGDMRAAKECVLSRGPWPKEGRTDAIEILFDDDSDQPFALHLTPESFSLLPAEPPAGHEWVVSVWTQKDGKPHKALERLCHWRRVDQVPYMKTWKEKP